LKDNDSVSDLVRVPEEHKIKEWFNIF
jgi:hypothetical protein